ncbi:MAG: DUF1616 domain-containing protein [Chloroflexota bacterium]
MTNRRLDQILIFIYTLIAAGFSLTSLSSSPLTPVIVVPYLFLIPGLSVVNNLFYDQDLPFYERFTYGMGVSVAIVVLGGLLLHAFGLGFRAPAWMLLTCVIVFINLFLTNIRRSKNIIREQYRMPNISIAQMSIYLLTVVIVILGLWFSYIGDTYQRVTYSEIWVEIDEDNVNEIVVNVGNHELQTMDYIVQVRVNRTPIITQEINGLGNNEIWETTFQLPESSIFGEILRVDLYRQDNPDEIYREVHYQRERNNDDS